MMNPNLVPVPAAARAVGLATVIPRPANLPDVVAEFSDFVTAVLKTPSVSTGDEAGAAFHAVKAFAPLARDVAHTQTRTRTGTGTGIAASPPSSAGEGRAKVKPKSVSLPAFGELLPDVDR